jgi:hypothetical protein
MLRRIATNTFASMLAACLLVAPATASADENFAQGTAWDLEVLTNSADNYLTYHGRLVVMVGTTPEEFRWGGTSCGSRTMSQDNVRYLTEAVREGMLITPRFQIGQGSAKCLVGFVTEKAVTTRR